MTHFISFKRHIAYSFFVLAMGTASAAGAATTTGPQLTVSNLQTDALIAPLGIADLTPKLSWTDTANVNGAVQTGYEIKAAASAADLTAGQLLWDSGQVHSSAQYAQYGGKGTHLALVRDMASPRLGRNRGGECLECSDHVPDRSHEAE